MPYIEDVQIKTVRAQIPVCRECEAEDNVQYYNESDTGAKGIICNNCGSEDFDWIDGEVEVEETVMWEMSDGERKDYDEPDDYTKFEESLRKP